RRQYHMNLLLLAYQSFGVVYGDLSTSPLYVNKSTFSGKLNQYQDEETMFILCGASMVIGDGILTPAISVLSSMSRLQVRATDSYNKKHSGWAEDIFKWEHTIRIDVPIDLRGLNISYLVLQAMTMWGNNIRMEFVRVSVVRS
ncbi:hypothetical protein ACJX0J_036721, partial [Zea mays]